MPAAPNPWWFKCFPTPYSGPYTQAWLGVLENQGLPTQHHNFHLQPSGDETADYLNLHIYFEGVSQYGFYQWRVFCSWSAGNSGITSQCSSWNQDPTSNYRGFVLNVDPTVCPTDRYQCAFIAAGNMLDCLTQQVSNGGACTFKGADFINRSFPNIRALVTQKDNIGRPGTLQNAFCDALASFRACSKH